MGDGRGNTITAGTQDTLQHQVGPGSNTGGGIPELRDRIVYATTNSPISGLDTSQNETMPHTGRERSGSTVREINPPVLERWRLREQKQRYGQVAQILDWGIDTVHYHVALDWPTLRECIASCEVWIEERLPNVRSGGHNGYSYTVTEYDGLRILVSSGKNPTMGLWVEGGAGWCLQRPAESIEWDIIQAICGRFSIEPELLRLRLRRVDPRFDFAGEQLEPYANLENLICMARKHRMIYGDDGELVDNNELTKGAVYGTISRFTGVTAGKSNVRARFYDKVVEAERGTLERWRQVWGGYEGDHVWRIEYQLRGDFLAEWGIENMANLIGVLGDLVGYLLTWLRFAEMQARKDIERPLLPWWAAIVETIMTLDLSRVGATRDVLPKLTADPDQLRAQLIGLTATLGAAIAFKGGHGWDYEGLLFQVYQSIEDAQHRIKSRFDQRLEAFKLAAYS